MGETEPTYRVRLLDGHAPARVYPGGRLVELENDGDTYDTSSRREYDMLVLLPFLEGLGEVELSDAPAKTIVAGIGERTDEELAVLVNDERKTVAAAASAEVERRAAAPAAGENPTAGGDG